MRVDFSGCKSVTAAKNKAREVAFAELLEILASHFGADAVSVVGNAEVAIGLDGFTDADGFAREVCFTLKPVVKEPCDKVTASGKHTAAYDRLDEAAAYEVTKSEKEKAAEEKAKAKAAKVAKDKAAREKAKAEKSAKT